MRVFILPSLVAAFIGPVAAKQCHNFTIPVDISARTGVFDNLETPKSNLDATAFIQKQTQQGANLTKSALTGYRTTRGKYNIDANFCIPSGKASTLKDPTVQVLIHGIGFDKTYWDLPYNDYNYSYINNAVDKHGYCTLSFDRLGVGRSDHGDPKNEIQSFLEVEALAAMTRMLRNGTLPTVDRAFKRVVHVGHSFGAAQSHSLAAKYPDLSDGLVLTGFSLNASFVGYFGAGSNFQQARLNQPLRFGGQQSTEGFKDLVNTHGLTDTFAPPEALPQKPYDYELGYLTNSNAGALQYLFLWPGSFDEQLAYVGEATKQPVAIGELLTLGSVPAESSFDGPVIVVTGEYDLPYCGADCLNTGGKGSSIPAAVKMAYPQAKNFETSIQPATGHGLNFHYNATGTYNSIAGYLKRQNLQSR
ncbi:MAG: hypothetical protein M1831_005801 [Alyxoria varia]|nr:MAG: hypothetical protein M1831_005801 [Alyxoria varia]